MADRSDTEPGQIPPGEDSKVVIMGRRVSKHQPRFTKKYAKRDWRRVKKTK